MFHKILVAIDDLSIDLSAPELMGGSANGDKVVAPDDRDVGLPTWRSGE